MTSDDRLRAAGTRRKIAVAFGSAVLIFGALYLKIQLTDRPEPEPKKKPAPPTAKKKPTTSPPPVRFKVPPLLEELPPSDLVAWFDADGQLILLGPTTDAYNGGTSEGVIGVEKTKVGAAWVQIRLGDFDVDPIRRQYLKEGFVEAVVGGHVCLVYGRGVDRLTLFLEADRVVIGTQRKVLEVLEGEARYSPTADLRECIGRLTPCAAFLAMAGAGSDDAPRALTVGLNQPNAAVGIVQSVFKCATPDDAAGLEKEIKRLRRIFVGLDAPVLDATIVSYRLRSTFKYTPIRGRGSNPYSTGELLLRTFEPWRTLRYRIK